MSSEKKQKIDPETGLLERTFSLEEALDLNVQEWGKPRGTNVFKRIEPAINYI